MQACAIKDPELEEDDALVLGNLSAIDKQVRNSIATSRKSVRRKTVTSLGILDSGATVKQQMQILIRRCLPPTQW